MYIGNQKILQEEELSNGLIAVKLEAIKEKRGDEYETAQGLDEYEILHFTPETLEKIKTEEGIDLSLLRERWCAYVIDDMIGTLKEYSVPFEYIDYINQSILMNLQRAQSLKDRKIFGHHESKRNVQVLSVELDELKEW